jgi:uncharacterized membrane protein
MGLVDIIFGTTLTFIAAILSWKGTSNRPLLACIYPIIVNAIGVSAYLSFFYDVSYWIAVLTVGAGEFVASVIIGYPCLLAVKKLVNDSYIRTIKKN